MSFCYGFRKDDQEEKSSYTIIMMQESGIILSYTLDYTIFRSSFGIYGLSNREPSLHPLQAYFVYLHAWTRVEKCSRPITSQRKCLIVRTVEGYAQ